MVTKEEAVGSASFNARLWAGDVGAADAGDVYRRTRTPEDLLAYAQALYRRRDEETCAAELMRLADDLVGYAFHIGLLGECDEEQWKERAAEIANRAAALAEYFEWMSRFAKPYSQMREDMRGYAWLVARRGAIVAASDVASCYLLLMTEVRVGTSDHNWWECDTVLSELEAGVHRISSAGDRALVYGKLGRLLRECGEVWRGIFWGMRACVVLSCPLRVRMENIAVLFGATR